MQHPVETLIMNKPLYIIGDKFSNPSKGIAPHPLEGMGHIRNVDILTNPGSIRLNNLTTKQSSTTITGQIKWQRQDPLTGIIYAVDDAGVVYSANSAGGSWAVIGNGTGSGNNNSGGIGGGLEIWKGFLIVVGTSSLDAYGPLSGSPNWNSTGKNNFAPTPLDFTQSQTYSPIFKSIDDSLYIGNGRYVSRLQELTTFDPTSTGTFTWTQHAITLAVNYTVTVIRELGENLMIGTSYLNSSTIADIFPYMRSSLLLGIPIRIVEKGIRAMYNLGNRLYVLAGETGKLFLTDTTSATQIAQIPNYIINFDVGAGLVMFPDAIMYLKGKIWFGVSNSTLGNAGVWSWNPTNKVLQMENIISTGHDGSTAALFISSLQPLGLDSYLIAWKDLFSGTVYGVDLLTDSQRYTGYVGYVDSPLIKVGTILENSTTPQLEIALIKPLVTGQGVKIQYRKDLTSSFTDLSTIDFATYGAVQGYNISAALMTNLVFVQVRASLTAGASSNLSPELQSVALMP